MNLEIESLEELKNMLIECKKNKKLTRADLEIIIEQSYMLNAISLCKLEKYKKEVMLEKLIEFSNFQIEYAKEFLKKFKDIAM